MNRITIAISGVVLLAVLALSSIYVVDERQRALVLQFGQIKAVKEEPGLGFKIPFIQQVVYYDDRILSLDTESLEVTPLDDRRLVVDAFARWRISDVERFRERTGTDGDFAIISGQQRLVTVLNSALREVLGSVNSNTVLSADRVGLMNQIRDQAARETVELGIEVVDVRIKRADLPEQNLEETFNRMRAEREREAEDERARGQEAALRVQSLADRTAVELRSEAQRDSDIIRGEADAAQNRIFADAFGQDPEFFAFYRSLSAYEAALNGDNSTLVISPDSEFFEYLNGDQYEGSARAEAGTRPVRTDVVTPAEQ
ncbi:membrane protease subunit HflC [Monaibacterium marinum]|uniref:Protein HflC n=1 Tax=Pontivivens marinum TaxID=1690039 RepID=A0A2C9CUV3_9RHOB|nr:protease modulator HflC [Monaibacterium marinum]SOH95052.1 membrane protease subunit HflC [Monaibacterium marinum]